MSDRKPLPFIEPLGDTIYVLMDEREQKSSIIFTPQDAQQISEVGTVVKKGKEVNKVEVGDKIIISYYTGIHLQLPECYSDSKYHRIIREHEILCRISEE